MAKRKYYRDLELKSKRANERMRQFEKRGIQSPAYQSVQAKLEMLGKRAKGTTGRRFTESGNVTYNEYEALTSILDEFLYSQTTSTIRGYNKYVDAVWQGALNSKKISVDIERAGITKEQWFAMWKSLPDKNKRTFDSDEYIKALATYNLRHDNENFDVGELMKEFESTTDIKSAYASLGLSYKDLAIAKDLGVLS